MNINEQLSMLLIKYLYLIGEINTATFEAIMKSCKPEQDVVE